jgi:hypothetical protein
MISWSDPVTVTLWVTPVPLVNAGISGNDKNSNYEVL